MIQVMRTDLKAVPHAEYVGHTDRRIKLSCSELPDYTAALEGGFPN